MSDFKDFLNQVKIRLTNPLIFSFIFSWTIINWKVILGAFYLDKTSLKELGYKNFLDFVSDSVTWYNGICYPFLSAITYTLLSPLLRVLVQLFNTWINKKGNAQIHKVAKESFIPYELYDQLLEELQTQRKRNENMMNENILLSNQLSDLKSEYINTKNNLDSLISTNQKLTTQYRKTLDSSILDGKWKLSIKYRAELTLTNEVLILNSKIEIKQSSKGYYSKYYISNFILDQNESIFFVLETIDQQELETLDEINMVRLLKFNHITNLKKHGNNAFSGNYNKDQTIQLERIPD